MTGVTRRKLMGGAAAAGAVLGVGSLVPAAIAQDSLAIPAGPMRLSRRIERGLRDGQSIVIDRSWQVEFRHQGRGVAIHGEQIAVKVDAPEELAAIAKIEESRVTSAMWPILLSDSGLILAAGEHSRQEDVAAAVREAEAILARRKPDAATMARHTDYLTHMQQASQALMDQLPPDLFFPAGVERQTIRPINLPDGLVGEFVLVYSSHKAPGCQWLSHATRTIVTRIGADERHSRDAWQMTEV